MTDVAKRWTGRNGKGGREWLIAALAGAGAAIALLSMPVGLIETVVASSGLSEAIPAAAPPLGAKARWLMAGFSALMALGVVAAVRWDRTGDAPVEIGKGRTRGVQGARKMGFAFSKLTALARGRTAPPMGADAPILRRADAHPDAPARPPIFASRDFQGLDIFARAEPARRKMALPAESDADVATPAIGLARSGMSEEEARAPAFARPPFVQPSLAEPAADQPMALTRAVAEDAPFEDVEVELSASEALAPEPVDVLPPASVPSAQAPSFAPLPTQGLSITQLTERLERGLAQRARATGRPMGAARVIADMPVAPAVPVREAVAQDIDEALRAALGTLRTMTGHGA